MKVFIFAGQSNAQGYGVKDHLNPVPAYIQSNPAATGYSGTPTVSADSGLQYQRPTLANSPSLYNQSSGGVTSAVTDGWGPYDLCNPSFGTHAGERDKYGPELAFLAKYRADHPGQQVAVVKVVLGGSSLNDWLTGSMLPVWQKHIDEAKARLEAANIDYEWAGMVWVQGESGASSYYAYLHPTAGQEYKDHLRTLLGMFRARTSAEMPIVIGGLGSQMFAPAVIGTHSSGEDTPENRLAATNNRLQQQIAVGGDAHNGFYSRADLPTLQDNANPAYWYHVTSAGVLADGERAYAGWQLATGETSPPPPPPLVVKLNGVEKPWTVKLNGQVIGGTGDLIEIEGNE